MRKEYTKLTRQVFNENMEVIGEIEEMLRTSLIPDEGKMIMEKATGIKGTRVDLGTHDSEDNYVEIDADATVEDYLAALEELVVDTSEEG